MNRKMRRNIKKDHNFLNEIMSIIYKYLPNFFDMFRDLKDTRNKSYITYSMKTICVTRFIALICGINSMHALTDTFNSDEAITNISSILNTSLDEIPHYDTINNVFENIDIEELRNIQKYIAYTIIRSKMFNSYRFKNKIHLIFDGTGLCSFNYKHCDNCLVKKLNDDTLSYEHYVLEAKLSFGNIVISLDSEFIENESPDVISSKKQDNEIKAFKRMATRIKSNFPKLSFIIAGDSLYACEPIIKICLLYHWDYIFTLKSTRLKTVNQDFEGIISFEKGSTIKNYFLLKNYSFQKSVFNIVRFFDEVDNKNFTYITNLPTSDDNIKQIISLGRKRWNIENFAFNEQKNNTFNINHLCSFNYNAMKAHYFFIQFAHTIRQLFDKGRSFIRDIKLKIKEISSILTFELISKHPTLSLDFNFQLRFDMLII